MKKLALKLDSLTVDTFDPAPLQEGSGTVLGEQATLEPQSCINACTGATCQTCFDPTCDAGCPSQFQTCNTCYPTCGTTCPQTCGRCTFADTCYNTCGFDTCQYTCGGRTCTC